MPSSAAWRFAASLDELLRDSDFITVHVPLTERHAELIGAAAFGTMKPGVRILNVARGGIINENELVEAIEAGMVAGAALDVFETEPLPADSPLRRTNQIILTPHLGGSTVEAQEQVAEDVAIQVVDVLNDRPARYAVNAPIIPPNDLELLIPYIDLAERMGRFIQQMDAAGVSDVEIAAHGGLADFDLSYIKARLHQGAAERGYRRSRQPRQRHAHGRTPRDEAHRAQDPRARSSYENMLTLSGTTGHAPLDGARGRVAGRAVHRRNQRPMGRLPGDGQHSAHVHQDQTGHCRPRGHAAGQNDVNISFMHVGRRGPRTEAIMALGTDELVNADILARIDAWDDINWLRAIAL